MIKVLLVDDEPFLCDLGKIFIEKTGDFIVDTAFCADEALAKLEDEKSGPYDALISDYEMPEKNGIEFLRELRKRDNNIPFLIFTGKGREEIVVEAIESGADYYVQKGGLPKPQFAELTYKLKKAVEKKKTDDYHLTESLRMEAIFRILYMKDASFKQILNYAVADSVRLSKSSFGYGITFDEYENPDCIIFCNGDSACEYGIEDNPCLFNEIKQLFLSCKNKNGSSFIEAGVSLNNTFSASCDGEKTRIKQYLATPVFENEKVVFISVVCNKKTPYDDSDKRHLNFYISGLWNIAGRRRTEEELRAANLRLAAACDRIKASEEMMKDQLLLIKDSEGRLKESEERLSLAIDGGELGIWDSDICTKKQTVNKKWADMLGYTCEEVNNVPDFWRSHVHPSDLPYALKDIDDYLSGKTRRYHSGFRMRCRDGRWKWIMSTGKISGLDDENRPLRISGIHRDITDQVVAEKIHDITRRKLKMFFDITSHDILNQVMIISGNSEILRENIPFDSKDQRHISLILDSAENITGHVEMAAGYLDAGLNEPVWQNVGDLIMQISERTGRDFDAYDKSLLSLQVFADPIFYSVLHDLVEDLVMCSEGYNMIKIVFEETDDFGIISFEVSRSEGKGRDRDHLFGNTFANSTDEGLRTVCDILSINGIEVEQSDACKTSEKFRLKIPSELYLYNKT